MANVTATDHGPPQGVDRTYTFMVTDIEESSALYERHYEAMQGAVAEHDAIFRAAIEGHLGQVFKTAGDSFWAVYESPHDAVATALEAQIELDGLDFEDVGKLRVRVAIYTGLARRRGDDYFGTALNRVARLLGASHGRQVVMCATTKSLSEDAMPDGATARSLGSHRLKGIPRPEEIFQLVHPGLHQQFAALKTDEQAPHNLPSELSTFIGRDQELSKVREALSGTRLLTLAGAGGCGKTRLALEAASQVLGDFEGGVWFIDLAPIADAGLVAKTAALAARVYEEPGRPIFDTLRDALSSKPTLLILDNCEHLIDAVAELAGTLLRSCPKLKIVCTSREALSVPGELAWKVPSLSTPERTDLDAKSLLRASEAARLFVDRATAVQPAFELTDANAGAIASICRRLDGIPLAIELAAARVKSLPVEQLAERLDDRFRLLTGGGRTALPRQQTLRATIDWSYNLLQPDEKRLLQRLAVFSGGWTLEAAETVCSGGEIEDWHVLDLLTHLVDKSLVVYEEVAAMGHYRMLETVRQYSREKLFDSEEATSIRDRHADYFGELVVKVEPRLGGPELAAMLDLLELEFDNIRAALEWADGSDDVEAMLRVVKGLHRFWSDRAYYAEGLNWLAKSVGRARALLDADPSADVIEDMLLRTLNTQGDLCRLQLDYQTSLAALESALQLSRRRDFKRATVVILNNLGLTHLDMGDVGNARSRFLESASLAREIDLSGELCRAETNLGIAARHLGDYAEARTRCESAQALAEAHRDLRSIAINQYHLGEVELSLGNLDQARRLLTKSLATWEQCRNPGGVATVTEAFAKLSHESGDHEQAARLIGAAEAMRERIGSSLPILEESLYAAFVESVMAALGGARFVELRNSGRRLDADHAVALARAEPVS